jgi:hypothetical protein
MVAVVDCWGDEPITVKALQHRLKHLKDLAAEYDPSNPAFQTKGKSTAKKAEGYVTPVSSPKASTKSPKKITKKRVVDDVAEVEQSGPRRTRRKVTAVKYVEPESDCEYLGEGVSKATTDEDEDEDDEWKPPGAEEMTGVEEEEEEGVLDSSAILREVEGSRMTPIVMFKKDVVSPEDERVTEGIKEVSNVLQENMSKANFEVDV